MVILVLDGPNTSIAIKVLSLLYDQNLKSSFKKTLKILKPLLIIYKVYLKKILNIS